MNPLVFAFSHPRYREELARLVPSLGIGKFRFFYFTMKFFFAYFHLYETDF